jgi:hypothetical protein
MQTSSRQFRSIIVAIAAAVLIYQLILPPVVALADNGDFAKVIRLFGLIGRVHERPYADTIYEFHPDQRWASGFRSSEFLLVIPALALGRVLSKDGTFDIRYIGVVHIALFLLAVWLFVPLLLNLRRGRRWLICALALLVFTDVMYAVGLNSFYMDEPAYLFLLLSTVLYLRLLRWHNRMDAVLLSISVLLLVGSKTQHAILGFWIAGLLVSMRNALLPKGGRFMTFAAVCLCLTAVFMFWKGAGPQYSVDSTYNVTFFRLLPRSKDVPRTLAELGLDDSYRPYIGKHCFMPGSRMDDPTFVSAFSERVSMPKIGAYYLHHPAYVYRDVRASLSDAGGHRMFGNFDRSQGYPEYFESHAFALWSDFKTYCFKGHGPRYVFTFLIAGTLLCALAYTRRRRLPAGTLPAVLVLAGMALSELMIASLADPLEIARHHLIFFELFDLMLLSIVGVLLAGHTPNNENHQRSTWGTD